MGEAHAYRWAFRTALLALVILAVIAVPLAWALAGQDAALATGIGVLVAAVATLVTPLAMLKAHRLDPVWMAALMGFTWLGKMLVIVVALVVLGGIEGFQKVPFGLAVVAGVLATVAIDMLAIRRSRVPHVVPGSEDGAK